MEHKIAVVAIAHAILEILWHVLAKGITHRGEGDDYLDRWDK